MRKVLPLRDRLWCLRHGFRPTDMNVFGRENLRKNYKDYLSNRDYCKLHPMNGEYSFWIDDKLTMKYPNKETVEAIRRAYPVGCTVELVQMDDPQAPPPGTLGKVIAVDDIATIHVAWSTVEVRIRRKAKSDMVVTSYLAMVKVQISKPFPSLPAFFSSMISIVMTCLPGWSRMI